MNIRTYFRGLLYPKNSQKYGINLKNKKVCHSVIYEGKKREPVGCFSDPSWEINLITFDP